MSDARKPTARTPRGRVSGVLPVVLCALVLAAVVAAAPPGRASAAAPPGRANTADPGEGSDRGPVRIALETIAPQAPGPGDVLRLTGRLTSSRGVGELSVRLRYSANAFSSRGVMASYAAGGASPSLDTRPVRDGRAVVTERRGADSFSITAPVEDLGLGEFGVYPLAIEVLSGDRRVALQRTFLPYVPENFRVKPTRVAWLWPMIDRPHRAADGVFIDNKLESALSRDGRLGRLLAAAAEAPAPRGTSQFPLLWAVDPALLQSAQEMADGYEVRPLGSEQTRELEPSATAEKWLDRLRGAVADQALQTVFSLPYADPDVVAMHRAGLNRNLTLAITRGGAITREALGRRVTPDVVWPPGGWLNQDTLGSLAVAGTKTVILNDRSLPPAGRPTYTPNAATSIRTVGGRVRVLVADSTLTAILGSATRAPGSAVLARQRFLAETALITDERPYEKGTLLIAPPRRWNPPPGFAAGVLADSARVPWLRPVGLSYLRSHPSSVPRADLRYPASARQRELAQGYLATVRRMRRELQRFASILGPSAGFFDFATLRTTSSAWREAPILGRRLLGAVGEQLAEKRSSVHIVTRGPILLASNAATVPITIANGLTESDLTVTVGLEVRPRNRARIDVSGVPDRVRIQPEHKRTVQVRMRAVTSGTADVFVQLQTPEGKDYGEPVRLEVRATGYGTTALVVTGGAASVLFLTAAARLVRRPGRSRQGGGDGQWPDGQEQGPP